MSLKQIRDATSLGELALACRRAERALEKENNAIAQYAAKRLVFRLIYETPVDTSQALSNWQVSFAMPSSNILPAYKEGENGSTKDTSAARAYAIALRLIKQKKPRIDLILSNNVPYIHKLNFGGSRQQPSAFYIQRITAQVNAEVQTKLKDYVNGY